MCYGANIKDYFIVSDSGCTNGNKILFAGSVAFVLILG